MSFIGVNEVVLVVALLAALVLGPKKLPELAKALGKAKTQFKKSKEEAESSLEDAEIDAEKELEDLQSTEK